MTGRCGRASSSSCWYLSLTLWLCSLVNSLIDMVELNELILDGVRLDGSGVGVRGRPCGLDAFIRRAILLVRLKGRTSPRYDISVISVTVDDPGSDRRSAGIEGEGIHVTHYITLHSPSFCWPILLRVMRSRWRGPFLPERFSSSRRSRALGKSWAVLHRQSFAYSFRSTVLKS